MMKYVDVGKAGRFCRSLNEDHAAGSCNPWALLSAAIIAQAAVDCSNFSFDDPDAEAAKQGNRPYLTLSALRDFINSDWIDMLLCWQKDITPLSVCEELCRRMWQKAGSESARSTLT